MNIKLFFQLLTGIFGVLCLMGGIIGIGEGEDRGAVAVLFGIILIICCLALIY